MMCKRAAASLLAGMLLMTIFPTAGAESAPEPTPSPVSVPASTPSVYETLPPRGIMYTVPPSPLPTEPNGKEMKLDDWYEWYYGTVLNLPNGKYRDAIYIRDGRVIFDEYNLPEAVGETYPDKTIEDFDLKSPALYTATLKESTSAYPVRSIYVERLFRVSGATKVDVLYVDPLWVIVRYKGKIGYVKRHRLLNVTAVDPVNTPPYGVQKHQYVATTKTDAYVRASMSFDEPANWALLKPGTTLSIWRFVGEWAVVNYWRTYGYIHISELEDLRMVSPTDEPLSPDSPIAAYTSYYKVNSSESIQNRMVNIDLGIQRMSIVLQPGQTADANQLMGPYSLENGFLLAGALVDGGTTLSPGGGTCQVSSTLYNVLLQCPGIKVLYRRAHGDNGAPYLPMHVDAAVGNSELNLVFRNDYDFPIRLEGHTNYDGALCWLIYRADTEAAK